MKSMRTKLLVGVVVAITGLLANAGAASADPFAQPDATCQPGRILARPPLMSPWVQGYSSGSTTVLNGSQRVAFRANLARAVWNGSRWDWPTVRYGTWKTRYLALSNDFAVSGSDLATYDLNDALVSGLTYFPIAQPGYYAVYFDLYWYGNQYLAAHSLSPVWAAHTDVRVNVWDLREYAYCQY